MHARRRSKRIAARARALGDIEVTGKPVMIPDLKAERKYLDVLVRVTHEARQLFTNPQKRERERMVCRAFLRCIGVDFSELDLCVGPKEPIDIAFGDTA